MKYLLILTLALSGCASMTPEQEQNAVIAGVAAVAVLAILSAQDDDEDRPCSSRVTTTGHGTQTTTTTC
jgi:uncharacterized lipoprotein YmbA